MKTIHIKFEDIDLSSIEKFKNWKLCYINTIPETYNDYDEETIEMMQSNEYQEYKKKKKAWYDEYFKTHHSMSGDIPFEWDRINNYNWKYGYKDYPTPDYKEGYTHYLYFTSDFENQWGDDWDDAPYEHNAEEPYDHKTDVLKIACKLSDSVYLPCDRFYNSPFSVEDINNGAIPWIWDCIKKTYLMGGFTLEQSLPLLYEYYKNLSNS